jgi:predicted enzyme related to lactoylglutathione lyase
MERVTGIGGVFLKAQDPKTLASWYQKHLGIPFGDGLYVDFPWTSSGHNVFSFFKSDSKYFQPADKPYMINFRVQNLKDLMVELEKEGVTIVGNMEETDYGNFGWIMDPEGNKVELWEPKD